MENTWTTVKTKIIKDISRFINAYNTIIEIMPRGFYSPSGKKGILREIKG